MRSCWSIAIYCGRGNINSVNCFRIWKLFNHSLNVVRRMRNLIWKCAQKWVLKSPCKCISNSIVSWSNNGLLRFSWLCYREMVKAVNMIEFSRQILRFLEWYFNYSFIAQLIQAVGLMVHYCKCPSRLSPLHSSMADKWYGWPF